MHKFCKQNARDFSVTSSARYVQQQLYFKMLSYDSLRERKQREYRRLTPTP
jgi:hypothetical protein